MLDWSNADPINTKCFLSPNVHCWDIESLTPVTKIKLKLQFLYLSGIIKKPSNDPLL